MTPEEKAAEEKKLKRIKETEPYLNRIHYFTRPVQVSTLPEKTFTSVYAASHYCYALCASSNELYSWGIGENYVLGTREDENCFTPNLVSAKMFYDCKIRMVGTGTQHLAVLTATPDNGPAP
jgi:regulator of chromosome condensation